MSSTDVCIKEYLTTIIGLVLIIAVIINHVPGIIKNYVEKIYSEYFQSLQMYREKLLKQIVTDKPLKILELRLNQGENLSYYPENSDIFVVSASDERAVEAMKHPGCKWAQVEPHIHKLQHFDNGELDLVVGTGALCRCRDPSLLMQEISRVLAPDGKYFFLEHSNEYRWQVASINRWIVSYLAKFWLYDMCNMNTDAEKIIYSADFSNVKMRKVQIRSRKRLLGLIDNHVIGVATK